MEIDVELKKFDGLFFLFNDIFVIICVNCNEEIVIDIFF